MVKYLAPLLALLHPLLPYAALLTGIAAVFTFGWKVQTDMREAALKRFDKFQQIGQRVDDPSYQKVRALIEGREEPTNRCSIEEKLEFMGFFEEIALMVNTGLMDKKVAFYMFGTVAVSAYDSDLFWEGIENAKDERLWSLFKYFCLEMRKLDKRYGKKIPVHKLQI